MKKILKIGAKTTMFFLIMFVVIITTPIRSKAEEGSIPPDIINIKQPTPDMPKEIVQYIGIWEGNLSNGRSIKIIIEDINIKEGRVTALYEWGPHSWKELRIPKSDKGGWKRMTGNIEKGQGDEKNVRIILESNSHGVIMETYNGKIAYGKSISGGGKWSNDFIIWKTK